MIVIPVVIVLFCRYDETHFEYISQFYKFIVYPFAVNLCFVTLFDSEQLFTLFVYYTDHRISFFTELYFLWISFVFLFWRISVFLYNFMYDFLIRENVNWWFSMLETQLGKAHFIDHPDRKYIK